MQRKKQLLIAGLLLTGIGVLIFVNNSVQILRSRAAGESASLTLPASQTVALNQSFDVPLQLNTGTALIRGVDVVMQFDPSRLTLVSITPNTTTSLRTFLPLTTANQFNVATIVSTANQTGTIAFGAVTFDMSTQTLTSPYTGAFQLATLRFTAKASATISLQAQIGSTTDSNVVSNTNPPTDILTTVTALQVSVTSSSTPTPSSAVPTPTINQGNMRISLTAKLHGIGTGGDNVNPTGQGTANPLHPQRTMQVEVYNTSGSLLTTRLGAVNFSGGVFTGTIDMGTTLPNGLYTLRFITNQFLKRKVNIVQLTTGQQTNIGTVIFVNGDANNDNSLSILDYNMLIDCYSDLSPARNCTDIKKTVTDFTDDGSVNQSDYNLFLRELSVQAGD